MLITNYFKIALRNIRKNTFLSILNILGLSIGIACAIFITLYIQDELNYDKYHEKHKRIYRIESDFTLNGKRDQVAASSWPIGPTMKKEIPEIEEMVRLMHIHNWLVKYGDKAFYEENLMFADSTIFKIFTLKMLRGNPDNALCQPNSMVLSASMAKKYFGNEDPLGKILITNENGKFKVTGVFEDLPKNLHIRYDALISMTTLGRMQGFEIFDKYQPIQFWSVSVQTYILLNKNSNIKTIHEKYQMVYDKYMKEVGEQLHAEFNLKTSNLADIHLHTKLKWDSPTGNIAYIYIFGAVALFILLIACINYMNMATARSENRAKEVGIRKVLGADKGKLIRQFLSESLLMTIIAMLIAILTVELLLNSYNNFLDKELSFSPVTNPAIIIITLLITIAIGILSGSYPALYLSSFRPVIVLKGKINTGRKGGLLRKFLVTFQFIISISMIIGTIILSQQLNYVKKKDLGYDTNDIMLITMRDTAMPRKMPYFRKELLQNPNIIEVSTATYHMGLETSMTVMNVEKEHGFEDETVNVIWAGHEFINVMKMELLKGRNFDINMKTDAEQACLVNESAVKTFGWGEKALGKRITLGANLDRTGGEHMKVIGVLKDFNYESLHNPVNPIVIKLSKMPRGLVHVKMKPENKQATLAFIEEKWSDFSPSYPLEYTYLEDKLSELYKDDQMTGKIFIWFAIITIFISLIGLFGLISFVAEQRTKEIAIRKVLGAGISQIVRMLQREFLVLVGIAFTISSVTAWFALEWYLEKYFVYHIQLSIIPFIIAGLIAFVISILTISYHTIRAANTNPADAIKYE